MLAFCAVFGMLLGDTIILDNLDSANRYRQEVNPPESHGETLLFVSLGTLHSSRVWFGSVLGFIFSLIPDLVDTFCHCNTE